MIFFGDRIHTHTHTHAHAHLFHSLLLPHPLKHTQHNMQCFPKFAYMYMYMYVYYINLFLLSTHQLNQTNIWLMKIKHKNTVSSSFHSNIFYKSLGTLKQRGERPITPSPKILKSKKF